MGSFPSDARQQLVQLYRDRLPGKLKLCALLIQQAQRNQWAAGTTERLHLELERLLRGARNFGLDDITAALESVKAALDAAAGQASLPDDDTARQLRSELLRIAGVPMDQQPVSQAPQEHVAPAAEDRPAATEPEEAPEDSIAMPGQEELPQAVVDALVPHPERPVLLQLPSSSRDRIHQALYLFGYKAEPFDGDLHLLRDRMASEPPMLVVMPLPKAEDDVAQLASLTKDAPCSFLFYASVDTLENRLRCVRAGGRHFAISPLDEYQLLTFLENDDGQTEEEPLRVLVVEDSRSQGLFCKRTLEKVGMAAEWIAEPDDLIPAVHRFEPELILMDMQLPGCSGMELAQVLQQLPDTRTIPVIYASAEEDPEKRERALQTAGEGFLDKPVQAEALVKAVRHRALRYRLTRSLRHTDELTRLPNRTTFLRDLHISASRSLRYGVDFTVALLDIRGLDAVRSSKGEAGAERLVQTLAHLLRQRTRCSDHVARLADGRFGLVLYDCPAENAERLLQAISQLWNKVRQMLLLTDESYLAWGIEAFSGGDVDACYQKALAHLMARPERPPSSIRSPKA
jgi:diguanylate cyclase (GGDEF)-like protein